MPIYGYRCSQCGHELEVLQSMSDAPLRVCPECSGALRKLLYPVGVQFKGSGFYTTDYRNGGSGSKRESAEPSTSSGESNGSSSSDKKTEKKAEAPTTKE